MNYLVYISLTCHPTTKSKIWILRVYGVISFLPSFLFSFLLSFLPLFLFFLPFLDLRDSLLLPKGSPFWSKHRGEQNGNPTKAYFLLVYFQLDLRPSKMTQFPTYYPTEQAQFNHIKQMLDPEKLARGPSCKSGRQERQYSIAEEFQSQEILKEETVHS